MDLKKVPLEMDAKKLERPLIVVDNKRIINAFQAVPSIAYFVPITPGMVAGNHYHKEKQEVFVVLRGTLKIGFCDANNPDDRGEEILTSNPDDDGEFHGLYVPTMVAHAVKNIGDEPAQLAVFATGHPRVKEDDFELVVLE